MPPPPPGLSARVHKPLISFLGKRARPPAVPPARPHPAAPPECRKTFSGRPPTPSGSLSDFWEAPSRFWRPRHHQLEQLEIDAIQSGGASLQ